MYSDQPFDNRCMLQHDGVDNKDRSSLTGLGDGAGGRRGCCHDDAHIDASTASQDSRSSQSQFPSVMSRTREGGTGIVAYKGTLRTRGRHKGKSYKR